MCTSCAAPLNQTDVEAFGNRLADILNDAGLALMLSIGHRTGLFDAMREMPPATSDQIAKSASLNERYVREWLGAMVTGRILTYEPETKTYVLPAEHAALLTRAASPDNFACTMQWIAELGQVESQIVDCFANGGGVSYSAFARFHEVMAEESSQSVGAALFDHILPLAGEMSQRLETGIEVADIGCGAGESLMLMAAAFPNSRFTGFDFSEQAIGRAREEANRRGLTNIDFQVKDAAAIGVVDGFDLMLAFDAIHDQRDPAQVLRQIQRALRADGTFLMQDIRTSSQLENNMEHPIAPFLFTISTMHCMTVSLEQGGAGLGTCWGVELAEQMLRDAGFGRSDVQELPHDIMNSYYVVRK